MNRPHKGRYTITAGRLILQAAGIAYPFVVYIFMGRIPLWCFLALGLAVGGAQSYRLRHNPAIKGWLPAVGAVAVLVIALYFVNARRAVQAYPIIISLGFAVLFGLTLRFPPTVAERIARLSQPDLPPEGVRYTRRVTWVWFAFLLINAATALALTLWGTLTQWTLWCGLLSYVAMGLLFAGEYIVRRIVQP
ncbi:MAG: hypothetical protein WCD42_00530 [Rhizomicrobium sp.]